MSIRRVCFIIQGENGALMQMDAWIFHNILTFDGFPVVLPETQTQIVCEFSVGHQLFIEVSEIVLIPLRNVIIIDLLSSVNVLTSIGCPSGYDASLTNKTSLVRFPSPLNVS